MVYYEGWIRLKPDPTRQLNTFKSSDPFDADTPSEGIATAMEWMNKNNPANHEADELWLLEGATKTVIWSSRYQ